MPGGSDDDEDTYDALADAALQGMIDRQRRADAAGERRREHWLRQQSREEGSFSGVLTDLGERGELVAVATVARRTLHGVVRTVGIDFVGLRGRSNEVVLVPLDAITAIRAEPGGRPTVGDREVEGGGSLDVALSDLAAERPRVVVHTWGGETSAGDLWSVGRDLVVLRGASTGHVYVPLDAINDVTLV